MKSQLDKNSNTVNLGGDEEITKEDILTLALIKNIKLKDKNYAINHLKVNKRCVKTIYEVEINDIDGAIYQLMFELKSYNK